MRKILLSTIVMVSMATAADTNAEIETLKNQMAEMSKKLNALEKKEAHVSIEAPKHKSTTVKSHVPVLKFSGTHYLGFVSSRNYNGDKDNKFETRRNYFQAKAYFSENPKDYIRLTLDTFDEKASNPNGGQSSVREKYAYLYLDNVLPNTGIELGQTHRPWIDYEEHNGWNYRSISKTMVEEGNSANLTNSADRGFDLKTKTPYFSSEFGVFNGEGYHNVDADLSNGSRLSGEWRMTAHLLGTGKKKANKDLEYAHLSFFGQENKISAKHGNEDLLWMGIHAVYNQPRFLIAAQYVKVRKGINTLQGEDYSVNGEFRVTPKWNTLARYDLIDLDDPTLGNKKRLIAGVSYKYNKNVEFIANYLKESGSIINTYDASGRANVKEDALMLTAEVEW